MESRQVLSALIIAVYCSVSSAGVADEPSTKLPIKMTWQEAESWLSGRGCTVKPDLQPDMPGWLIGWCQSEPKIEITFMFSKPGDVQPATCVTLAFNPTGTPDWKPVVKVFTGADVAKLPKAPGDNKSRRFVVKTPTGSVKLLLSDRGRDVGLGEKCDN